MRIKKMVLLAAAIMSGVIAAQAADLYFDLDGAIPGFGTSVTPMTVDFTALTWNTDPSGGGGGSIVTVSTNDFLHFGLEGGATDLEFNWQNYAGVPIAGVHTYQTLGSTAEIQRFQKAGGGYETLSWSTGAVFNTEAPCSLYWDFGTTGDFEKTGTNWLVLADGGSKVIGTMTVSDGFVVVRQAGTVTGNSSFKLNGAGLRFTGGLAGIINIGTLSGSGEVTVDGAGDLSALTLNVGGFDCVNSSAEDSISFGWGASATLASGSTTALEINKSEGTNYADKVYVEWPEKTFTLNGDLVVTLLPGSDTLLEGDSFQLLSSLTNQAGAFNSISLPALSSGLSWNASSLVSSGLVSVVLTDTNAPAIPTGLTALITNVNVVSLDWNDNTEPTLGGYKVYRAEIGGEYVEVGDTALSEFFDSSVSAYGGIYYYAVTAYNSIGTESDLSTEVATYVPYSLKNGGFELPLLSADGEGAISASGDWVQNGSNQVIRSSAWAMESGAQGVWYQAWNANVTNSFYQELNGIPGAQYVLDAGFRIEPDVIPNGGQMEMALIWQDATDTEISRETLDVDATYTNTAAWEHLDISGIAPSGTKKVRAWFRWSTTADADNGSGKSVFVDNVTISHSGSVYDAWAASYGLLEGPDGDDDDDSRSNLLEYGLNGNPTNSADRGYLSYEITGGGAMFSHTYAQRTHPNSGIIYTLEQCSDLVAGNWSTNGLASSAAPYIKGFEAVTTLTSTVETNKFIRLRIEEL